MQRIITSGFFSVVLLAAIAVLHVLAIVFGWYVSIAWFDDFHHVLGGVWVASAFWYFFSRYPGRFDLTKSFPVTLIFAMGVTALAGIGWEVFEFLLDALGKELSSTLSAQGDLKDTMTDLVFDVMGGAVFTFLTAFGLFRK